MSVLANFSCGTALLDTPNVPLQFIVVLLQAPRGEAPREKRERERHQERRALKPTVGKLTPDRLPTSYQQVTDL